MFIKLIEDDITPRVIELRGPRRLPMHDTVFMYFLKTGHFTYKRYNINKILLKIHGARNAIKYNLHVKVKWKE